MEMCEMVNVLSTWLTKNEFLELQRILDEEPDLLYEEVSAKAVRMAPELFTDITRTVAEVMAKEMGVEIVNGDKPKGK